MKENKFIYGSSRSFLMDYAIKRESAKVTSDGVLCVETGSRTGRSVKDRYIVMDSKTIDTVNWGKTSNPYSNENFKKIWEKACVYQSGIECFVSDLQVGDDDKYGIGVKAITEYAWHQLFVRNLFVREVSINIDEGSQWTLLSLPGFNLDPEVDKVNSEAGLFIDFTNKRVLLCGLRYAGEMKKAMFSILNYLLPVRGVLPMHCAANTDLEGNVALFFGLSGTGKTTLSADESRFLIGDDEHGWSVNGVFNFEGGCYAKCVDLTEKKEPMIWHAVKQSTAILENVVLDENNNPDFSDTSLTSNTRAGYPRDVISNIVKDNCGDVPKSVIFLTCDLYGVLPPVSILNEDQAVFWFLNGYTAQVGSTVMGSSSEIEPVFSTCFGAAFFPRIPLVYADLLRMRLRSAGSTVYLVNTGWMSGSCTEGGRRFDLSITRKVIDCIHKGEVKEAQHVKFPGFNLSIPESLPGIESDILDPRKNWADKNLFEKNYRKLIEKCNENYKKYEKMREDSFVDSF